MFCDVLDGDMSSNLRFISTYSARDLLEREGIRINNTLITGLCRKGIIAHIEAGNRLLIREDLLVAWADSAHKLAEAQKISVRKALQKLVEEVGK